MVGRRDVGADRGVSPVIAVILLVAITVLLATTAGYVVFGFTDETTESAPTVAVTTTYDERTSGDGQSLTIEFRSGDTLAEADTRFDLQGAASVDRTTGDESTAEIDGNQIDAQLGSEVTAGEELTIDASTTTGGGDYLDLSDATVRLVWDPADPEIQQSETIWRWSPQ